MAALLDVAPLDRGAPCVARRSRAKLHRERVRRRDRVYGALHPGRVIRAPPGLPGPAGSWPHGGEASNDGENIVIVFTAGEDTTYSLQDVLSPVISLCPRPRVVIVNDGDMLMIEDIQPMRGDAERGSEAAEESPDEETVSSDDEHEGLRGILWEALLSTGNDYHFVLAGGLLEDDAR
eukprot:6975227-Lingulodinium_polyedra.AAC.1